MTQIQLICAVWASFSLSRTRIHLAHPTPLLNDVATMITASSRPWSSAVPWCRQQEFGICELSCCYIASNTALPGSSSGVHRKGQAIPVGFGCSSTDERLVIVPAGDRLRCLLDRPTTLNEEAPSAPVMKCRMWTTALKKIPRRHRSLLAMIFPPHHPPRSSIVFRLSVMGESYIDNGSHNHVSLFFIPSCVALSVFVLYHIMSLLVVTRSPLVFCLLWLETDVIQCVVFVCIKLLNGIFGLANKYRIVWYKNDKPFKYPIALESSQSPSKAVVAW
ncbi:hypothetical protein K438DRAFT_1780476 [Mycena galopus ATCC 62051]|nr:hypothetical protein K438DRAFT_1780476 [Mycena galopus ATCC 62051]